MEKNKTNISIKDVLLYFGKIQFAVVISFIISIPFITLIRFFTDIRTLQDVIWGIIGLLLECGVLIYIFYKEKKEDRRLDQSFVIKTISFALIPHFILSLCFQFYSYISGVGVQYLSNAWGSIAAGEYLKDHRDVPLYMSIVLMIPMMALIVLSAYLGFKYGDKKIKKEHEDFLRKHGDVSND